MAEDFLLSAGIYLSAADALKTLKNFGDEATKAGEKTENMASGSELSMSKLNMAFQVVGQAARGIWDDMIENSPSMQVAMVEADLAAEEVTRTLGESLAPILEETIIPLITGLKDIFMALSPEIQTTIAVVIALTVGLTILIPIVAGLAVVFSALTWPILAVVAAVVLLVYVFTTDLFGIRTLFVDWWENGIKPIFEELGMAFGDTGSSFSDLWKVIEPIITLIVQYMVGTLLANITNVFAFIANTIISFMELFTNVKDLFVAIFTGDMPGAIEALGGIFKNVFEIVLGNALTFFMDMLVSKIEIFKKLFSGLGDMFTDLFGDDTTAGKIGDLFTSIINGLIMLINEKVIQPINDVLSDIKDIEIAGGKPFDWITTIPQLPTFHDGGIIKGNGEVPIMGLAGEEVVTEDNPRHIKNAGKSSGTTFNNTFNISVKAGMNRSELQSIGDEISRYLEKQAQLKGKF